jgi:hypothetical protein
LDTVIANSMQMPTFGGKDETGPESIGSRKTDTKHTLLVDRHGMPSAIRTTPADASDQHQIIPLVLKSPEVGHTPGRRQKAFKGLSAVREYDNGPTRRLLPWLGAEPFVSRRRMERSNDLGKICRHVNHTIS